MEVPPSQCSSSLPKRWCEGSGWLCVGMEMSNCREEDNYMCAAWSWSAEPDNKARGVLLARNWKSESDIFSTLVGQISFMERVLERFQLLHPQHGGNSGVHDNTGDVCVCVTLRTFPSISVTSFTRALWWFLCILCEKVTQQRVIIVYKQEVGNDHVQTSVSSISFQPLVIPFSVSNWLCIFISEGSPHVAGLITTVKYLNTIQTWLTGVQIKGFWSWRDKPPIRTSFKRVAMYRIEKKTQVVSLCGGRLRKSHLIQLEALYKPST